VNAPLTAAELPRGFTFAGMHCGLKKTKLDLGLLLSDVPGPAAAVFTSNQVAAAPVLLCRAHMRKSSHKIRGIIVNSGNANCCSGPEGYAASVATAERLAQELGRVEASQLLVCSTGVIGAPLQVDKILASVPELIRSKKGDVASFEQFARSIMTTDTVPKWATERIRIGGRQVRIAACAKGSGMIHPNMATMFGFIATDAAIPAPALSRVLRAAVGPTFNSITVDGDTSTNDTAAVLANGESGVRAITGGANYEKFFEALHAVCKSLALAIVADGEGAQRVIEIEVRGAPSDRAADQVARTIANSPLVKTAMAGADPNWGRILAAAGRSGVKFNFERTDIWLAGVEVCRGGREYPFDEIVAHEKMLEKFVPIVVDLHSGEGKARMWTCDFTKEYIHINASYRT
jgi:glutamate N-acetyltransferase / amino-acid N-acetyltransferase